MASITPTTRRRTATITSGDERTAAGGTLSTKWRDVQGAHDWKGLLPEDHGYVGSMDEDLRSEIIKYGVFAQVCYDAFEDDGYCRGCRFNESELLEEAGLSNRGYTVTGYLYATAQLGLPSSYRRSKVRQRTWSKESSWMGFVAVSTSESEIRRLGRRDIVVVWRGTRTPLEWMENLKNFLLPTGLDPTDPSTLGVKVACGFLSIYTSSNANSSYSKSSAREQLWDEIARLVEVYKGEELSITMTGHSLGGALALLSAYDLAELGVNGNGQQLLAPVQPLYRHILAKQASGAPIPITVFSFSAPRVGNKSFCARCNELGVKVLRTVNKKDIVPKVPGVLFSRLSKANNQSLIQLCEPLPWAYTHVGTKLALDGEASPFLRCHAGRLASEIWNLEALHNLKALLLHLVDPSRPFPSGRRAEPARILGKSLKLKTLTILRGA